MLFIQGVIFGISPYELSLLDFYLEQPHQDPEWVQFVRNRLQTQGLSPEKYEVMVRDFLNTEACFATRDQISSLYQKIFYGRDDPSFFINPIDLDGIVHVYLEKIEFDQSALTQVLFSFCTEGHNSPFYSDIKATQAEYFNNFMKLKAKDNFEMQERENIFNNFMKLKKKMEFLQDKNTSLRQRLFIDFP